MMVPVDLQLSLCRPLKYLDTNTVVSHCRFLDNDLSEKLSLYAGNRIIMYLFLNHQNLSHNRFSFGQDLETCGNVEYPRFFDIVLHLEGLTVPDSRFSANGCFYWKAAFSPPPEGSSNIQALRPIETCFSKMTATSTCPLQHVLRAKLSTGSKHLRPKESLQ